MAAQVRSLHTDRVESDVCGIDVVGNFMPRGTWNVLTIESNSFLDIKT